MEMEKYMNHYKLLTPGPPYHDGYGKTGDAV